MIIESIDPMRDEYIRIFEMFFIGVSKRPGARVFKLPEFRYVKFGLPMHYDDSERYYIPSAPGDPRIWLRQYEPRIFNLTIGWSDRNISRGYHFDISSMEPMMGDIVKAIIAGGSGYEYAHQIFWKYVPPKCAAPERDARTRNARIASVPSFRI